MEAAAPGTTISRAVLIAILWCGTFCPPSDAIGQVAPIVSPAHPDQKVVVLAVPHIRQEKDLCVPTSAAMVLSFFGDPHSPRELKVLSRGRQYDPSLAFDDFSSTWFKDMVGGMRLIGYTWTEDYFANDESGFASGLAEMELSLSGGNPVLVDTSFPKSEGHTFVVVGIDRRSAQLHIVDPDMPAPGRRVMTLRDFELVWNSTAVGANKRGAIFTRRRESATAGRGNFPD